MCQACTELYLLIYYVLLQEYYPCSKSASCENTGAKINKAHVSLAIACTKLLSPLLIVYMISLPVTHNCGEICSRWGGQRLGYNNYCIKTL